MKREFCLLLLICFLFTGCAFEQCKPDVPFPLKIGLLADSQITSQNGFSNFHYRSKRADALVDVSIRPPALECYLAEEMLHIALDKLTEDPCGSRKGVDVILYLGDAANSGGTDEIETVLTILDKHRQKTGTPIFIIIGNHDYLGAGNVVSPGIRFAMLNREGRPDNHPLTKYEVLKKFSQFNHRSNRIPANSHFSYVDNFSDVEQNKDLDHDTGLFLAGILNFSEAEKGSVEIFLLDSSDYKDAPDWSEVADWGFYGVIGSISFKDEAGFVSQAGYFKKFAQTSSPDYRFLASHYPKDHLDRITFAKPGQVPLNFTNFLWDVTECAISVPTFSKTLNQNLEKLLTSQGGNYWLSAHTHVKTMQHPKRFIVGGLFLNHYFEALNIGSTTDYRAHVTIVERYQKGENLRLDRCVGYREIPLFNGDPILLTAIPKAIGEYGKLHADEAIFQPLIPSLDEWTKEFQKTELLDILPSLLDALTDKKSSLSQEDRYWIDVGATILGMSKRYRQKNWTDPHTVASEEHLRNFVNAYVSRTGSKRADVISYLGLLAGAYENGLLPARCDFSPKCLKNLCAF